MRAAIAASLALAAVVAGCSTVRPVENPTAPLGKSIELKLPSKPWYRGKLEATQTIIAQYGERRQALQAVISLSPDRVQVVLTSANGPRILSITWTEAGVIEDRTPLAPADLKGVNILADIYLSLWPEGVLQATLPQGVIVVDQGDKRVIRTRDHVIVEIETQEGGDPPRRQKLTNFDFGYSLTIITERTM